MTIYEIDNVVDMIDECMGTSMQVDTVWEYTNTYNQETMFAVFTKACTNDLHISPAVEKPILIYENGEWYREYTYLNG